MILILSNKSYHNPTIDIVVYEFAADMATNDPPVNLRDAFFMVMISGQIESAEVIITRYSAPCCLCCILCVTKRRQFTCIFRAVS